MMIADLVDQDDLIERFKALGIDVSMQNSVDEACQAAANWYAAQDEAAQLQLSELVKALMEESGLVLPEVKEALKAHLTELV